MRAAAVKTVTVQTAIGCRSESLKQDIVCHVSHDIIQVQPKQCPPVQISFCCIHPVSWVQVPFAVGLTQAVYHRLASIPKSSVELLRQQQETTTCNM